MSVGLFGLLDDVAMLARLAAASVDDVGAAAGRATAKAAGVVIDDTAVTPQYVHGLAAERELPIIKRIAVGSLRNKMLTPILMLGGAYLCFEATEKIWGALRGHGGHGDENAGKTEDEVVSGAVRTDLILSAEIMVISLNEVAAEGFWSRLAILVVVALAITVVVYGVVALIVKMDDVGLHLVERSTGFVGRVGRAMVAAMPMVLSVISVVGTAAMLWVGGHILLVGLDDLGWHAPYDFVHHLEEAVHDAVSAIGGVLAWLTNTAASAVLGLLVGGLLVAVAHLLPFGHKTEKAAAH
jgi:predicted DNA repair protein MutK